MATTKNATKPGRNTKSAAPAKSTSRSSASSKNNAPADKTATKQASKSVAADGQDSRLFEFFAGELKDIYWAEKHLVKTLPKMAKAATSPKLTQAFNDHLEQTKTHVARLEQVFEMVGKPARAKKCDAMDGITKEGQEIIEETDKGTATRDVGLVLAGQKVEHYEIATYGGLAQLARTLGYDEAASLLQMTLEEEKKADDLLTQLAEGGINEGAASEPEGK